MKRETSCAPSKFGYLGVQIYLTLPKTPPPNIASNRRLDEGDPILARMDTYRSYALRRSLVQHRALEKKSSEGSG